MDAPQPKRRRLPSTPTERPWVQYLKTEDGAEELAELIDALRAAGIGNQGASGVVGWLLCRAYGLPDLTSRSTRYIYRNHLRLVEAPRTEAAA